MSRAKKKRVFVSFDFDRDKSLKDLLVGQARNKNSPFEIIDASLKEASRQKTWSIKAATKIKSADLVIVLLGEKTYQSRGVRQEIKIARALPRKVVQLIGHQGKRCPKLAGGGRRYKWSWENLRKLCL